MLPLHPEPAEAVPRFIDSGGYQKPIAQGPVSRLDRLGDKWGLDVAMPAMKWHKAGLARIWVSRLVRGRSVRVILRFPQPGFTPPGNDTAVAAVAAASAGTFVEIQGLPNVVLLEGQMVSHTRALTGRRYLYQVTADTNMGPAGRAVVGLHPRIRGPVAVGDNFKFVKPEIEGFPQGDVQAWTFERARTVGLDFSIEEAE